jgi:VIT family
VGGPKPVDPIRAYPQLPFARKPESPGVSQLLALAHESGTFLPPCDVRSDLARAPGAQALPKEEAEKLALIYAARGIPIAEARDVAAHLIANPDQALDTLAREELGLNPGRPPVRRAAPPYRPLSPSPSARACRSFLSSAAPAPA